jgi:predicted DNA-binding transcriptional regulator AlpA
VTGKPSPAQPSAAQKPMTSESLADYLEVSVRTVERWRITGGGPDFVPISRNVVRYLPSDVDAWLRSRARKSRAKVAA